MTKAVSKAHEVTTYVKLSSKDLVASFATAARRRDLKVEPVYEGGKHPEFIRLIAHVDPAPALELIEAQKEKVSFASRDVHTFWSQAKAPDYTGRSSTRQSSTLKF